MQPELVVQSDVGALAKEVAKALQQLNVSASRATQAVEVIRETEVARSRMQDASSTLKVTSSTTRSSNTLHAAQPLIHSLTRLQPDQTQRLCHAGHA